MSVPKSNPVNEALKLPLADAFEHDLNQALEDAEGSGIVILAVIDMDGLMKVNDVFGHECGDRVLIDMGMHFKERLPEGCRLYRCGGDEFTMLWNDGTEKEEAFLFAERLRAEYAYKLPDGEPATFSVGIAAAPEDGTRYHELVRKADGAMFRAKLSSRNRVCLAREEKMVTKTTHYTAEQLQRLTKLSKKEGLGEAVLLREALDMLLKKYDV